MLHSGIAQRGRTRRTPARCSLVAKKCVNVIADSLTLYLVTPASIPLTPSFPKRERPTEARIS